MDTVSINVLPARPNCSCKHTTPCQHPGISDAKEGVHQFAKPALVLTLGIAKQLAVAVCLKSPKRPAKAEADSSASDVILNKNCLHRTFRLLGYHIIQMTSLIFFPFRFY